MGADQQQPSMTFDFADTVIPTTARDAVQIEVEDRAGILERLDTSPIIIAITKQKMFPFEEVFRSQNLLIVNTVCKEFVFVLEFFDL